MGRGIPTVKLLRKYIQNQDAHHKKKTFEEEYQEWKESYGFFED